MIEPSLDKSSHNFGCVCQWRGLLLPDMLLRISTLFLRFVGKRAEIGCFPASAFLSVFGMFFPEIVSILTFLRCDCSVYIALELKRWEPIFPYNHPTAVRGEKLEIRCTRKGTVGSNPTLSATSP